MSESIVEEATAKIKQAEFLEQFFSSDVVDLKLSIKEHVTTVHNFQWDDHKLFSHNLINLEEFLREAGLWRLTDEFVFIVDGDILCEDCFKRRRSC